ncbi:conserved hypothetical protein [Trichormus variabilis ATCC 29413]|uniref:Conjugation TrbI-like protein n=3 Tax=Anabaena variabilis TaxID=264691 RepID=Q3M945_TRIV2|nr:MULTISPECIES: TrbI/VirB10 family protein [Nostocaceae]ABA22491.1 conserved hypothetical protein [Trichormus variabilis ATCC 29413]MBC1217003.1 hypothetical protein [Trichormus variabilis ARAD]MBC1256625.1 hypothetical protein [Trichormus variabilis V5]MBC1305162.1 hypothetical protein [Trichormus variabilis N2B]MBC1311189.1 hypothetical protein [Trichormus variabilis PNB]
MTPYSTTPETQPKPLTHPEVDAFDWESHMAKLVGLAAEPTKEVAEIAPTNQTSSAPPQEVQTEQPLASNPFAKLALVGTGTLVLVVIAGGFLSQIMSANNQKPTQNPATVSQPEAAATNFTPKPNLEQEVETLKTKLALAEQTQAVKVAQQNLRNAARVSVPQTNNPVTPLASPTTSTSAPRTVIIERPAQNPYPPAPMPVASSASPQLPPPPLAQPNSAPTPPNPWEEWSRMAKLGSYGQANAVDQPSMTVSSPPPLNVPRPTTNSNGEQPPQPPSSLISQRQSRSPQSLKVGTSAKAVLATAVFGETTRGRGNNDDNNENKNLFVVRLREPLKSVDGTIALPANTELLTELRSVSEQGVMQLNIAKMIVENNGELSERDIPNNALAIRGSKGSPLLARQYPDRGSSIAGMDAGLFILGGVAKAAELFNRTESQITTSTGAGTTISSTNPQRNLAAGIVEGGLNSVVPQISQRNQQAIAQMMQQTNVWLLGAGTEVEIYVNQPIQL